MVIGAQTHALFHSLYDLKVTQMNIWNSLIRELMLYEFKLKHSASEPSKNICCVKGEGAVDHSTVTNCFKKFCLDRKKLDNKARSSKPNTMDSGHAPSHKSKSSKSHTNLAPHSPVWFYHFHGFGKIFRAAKMCLTLPKYCKTFDSPSKYKNESIIIICQ